MRLSKGERLRAASAPATGPRRDLRNMAEGTPLRSPATPFRNGAPPYHAVSRFLPRLGENRAANEIGADIAAGPAVARALFRRIARIRFRMTVACLRAAVMPRRAPPRCRNECYRIVMLIASSQCAGRAAPRICRQFSGRSPRTGRLGERVPASAAVGAGDLDRRLRTGGGTVRREGSVPRDFSIPPGGS